MTLWHNVLLPIYYTTVPYFPTERAAYKIHSHAQKIIQIRRATNSTVRETPALRSHACVFHFGGCSLDEEALQMFSWSAMKSTRRDLSVQGFIFYNGEGPWVGVLKAPLSLHSPQSRSARKGGSGCTHHPRNIKEECFYATRLTVKQSKCAKWVGAAVKPARSFLTTRPPRRPDGRQLPPATAAVTHRTSWWASPADRSSSRRRRLIVAAPSVLINDLLWPLTPAAPSPNPLWPSPLFRQLILMIRGWWF